MALTVSLLDTLEDGKRVQVSGTIVASGNYVTAGDTLDFSAGPPDRIRPAAGAGNRVDGNSPRNSCVKNGPLDEIYDYDFEGGYIDISLLTPSGCELALYRTASNMLAARVGFHPFAEEFSGVLAEFAVFGSKCGGKMAIDVQLADHFARHKNRHDDFGLGLERAG
jgi:hypothetical protein